jgi:hypothetical protein
MSTLAVVEEILRETQVPMSVRQIVERAGSRLPTRSKTPDTVVARDLSMDLKRRGEASVFVRTSPGRYGLRAIELSKVTEEQMAEQRQAVSTPSSLSAPTSLPAAESPPTSVLASAMKAERAAALPAKKQSAADEQTGTLH